MRNDIDALVMILALAGMAVSAGAAPAGPPPVAITADPWRLDAGVAGVDTLYLDGRPLLREGKYAGYRPQWKGMSFSMSGCTREVDGRRVTWKKRVAGIQDCSLTATVAASGFRFALDTRISAPGPAEFSLRIQPEAVRASKTQLVLRVDGKPRWIALDGPPFARFRIQKELVFETPTRSIRISCPGMELQDRRRWGKDYGFYLVRVLSRGDEPGRRAQAAVEVTAVSVPLARRPGRARYLAQRPESVRAVPLANADLETLTGWTHGKLATVDTAVRHGGRAAARLTVAAPPATTAEVYITRTMPVTPGLAYDFSAWVRSDKVVPATIGGMWSVGATIIIEFADRQGKWFAGGRYAKGLYGTRDWQRLDTGPVTAPKGAGFAILYLALRGLGTAWFDDVNLREITDHVLLVAPLDGRSLRDNTPSFDWYTRRPGSATLELARTADFSATLRRHVFSRPPPVSLPAVLPPGTWYWRIRCGPRRVSPVWHFVQTAAITADCTPPVITPAHGFLATPRQPLVIPVRDNVGVTGATATLDGRPVPVAIRGQQLIFTPASPWSNGLHRLELRVEDAAGNRDAKTIFLTHRSPAPPKRVWLPERGTRSGEARDFPLGIYGVRVEDMSTLAAAGFTLVHSYAWDGSGDTASALAYLDAARKRHLQVFMGLCRRELMAGNEAFVAARVAALMGHPALYAWYLYDEPDLEHQYLPPERLAVLYRLIKRLDPFHPVILTCASNKSVPLYRDCCDVYWTQVYGDTRFVAARLRANRADLKPETAHAAILHCYDRAQTAAAKIGAVFDPRAFQPDAATMRANAFMALVHGSSGLLWWWWGGGATRFKTVRDAPAAWAALKRVVADLRSLRPALTAAGESVTQVVEPAKDIAIHIREMRVGGHVLVIAVNRDKTACTARLPLTLAVPDSVGRERFADREVRLRQGGLTDHFAPLEVHVYELKAR